MYTCEKSKKDIIKIIKVTNIFIVKGVIILEKSKRCVLFNIQ